MPCQTQRVVQRQKTVDQQKKKTKPPKRSDARKIVKEQAAKFGWSVKEKNGWKLTLTKPLSNDKIEVEILKRGMVKIDVPGSISAPNHANAERFLNYLPKALGGKLINLVHTMAHAAMHAAGIHHHHDH